MWRRFDPENGRKRGKVVLFWPHDSPVKSFDKKIFPSYDGSLMLSKHHMLNN